MNDNSSSLLSISQRDYNVEFEIAGSSAMFTRPDTGSSPVSYPAPTYSSAKALFESVIRLRSAYIRPTMVEICAPIKYQRYVTNYSGPLRSRDLRRENNLYKFDATILVDVCYRIYGEVKEISATSIGFNHLRALQEIFNRRLMKGQFYYTPCLGWKEFVPFYFGPFRVGTERDTSIFEKIPSMLFSVFDQPVYGAWNPVFKQNIEIVEGVLIYA